MDRVKGNITHHYVDGDIIPKMYRFFAVDHIGKVNIIPQITGKKDGALAAHANFVQHSLTMHGNLEFKTV